MCEFKIIDMEKDNQLEEEIVILSYSKNNKLQLIDILGDSKELQSALIYDVNTLDQTCKVFQHPIINPFLKLIKSINNKNLDPIKIKEFHSILDSLVQEKLEK